MSRNVGKCTYSEQGMARLTTAILLRAAEDFKIAANRLNQESKRKTGLTNYKLHQIGVMREVINFIMSDWFNYLTNGNCPQEDCVRGLLRYVDKSYHKEICKDLIELC